MYLLVLQLYRDPARGGSVQKLRDYMNSNAFREGIEDAYYEAKGVLPDDANAASMRTFTHNFVDPGFKVDDPMSLEYLVLRHRQCDMVSRLQLGGQEDAAAAYARSSTTNLDEAVGNIIL